MVSRLKIATALLLIAACIRLVLSNLDLYMYGSFRVPMHLQLAGPYIVLAVALARVRSERVSRWLLAYMTVQVVLTYMTCYALPRTLAGVLEDRVPCVALAQLLAGVLVLAGAEWCDRGSIAPRYLLVGALVALNVSTLLLFAISMSKLTDARDELISATQGPAMREAEMDIRAGRLRQYEVQTFRLTASAVSPLQSTFTGRTNGPFEIWSRPRYEQSEDERFRLKSDSQFVAFYNGRMAFLYGISQRHGATWDRTNSP
jgi:hypothetical protein